MSETSMHDIEGLRIGQEPEATASPTEIFRRVHRLLRGRYPIAIVLALVGGSLGAVAGYTSQTPLYQSTAKIHVKPMIGKILDETEMSTIMPMFRNYVNTQAALVESQRVLDQAMRSDAWRSLGRGNSPGEQEAFARALNVSVEAQSGQLIDIAFLDPDPKVAETAVKEVVQAYKELQAESERLDDPNRLNLLRDRKGMLANDIERRTSMIQSAASKYGTLDLAERHENEVEYLFQLEATERQLALELNRARSRIAVEGERPEPSVADDMDVAQIATVDQQMAQLLQERRQIEAQIERLRANGIGAKHRDMKRTVAELDAMDVQIRSYKEQWIAAHAGEDTGLELGVAGGDPAQIELQLDNIKAQVVAQREKTIELGKVRQQIEALAKENERDQAELERVEARLDQIALESSLLEAPGVSGRIAILSSGTSPTSPAVDRRAKLAVAGFVGGSGTPVALLMLLGLLGGRYRYSDETRDQIASPLLGILPTLPDNITDPEQAGIAAHCVHQIRTLLQIGVRGDEPPVFAVTSPTAGDGKTSLALSLGLSFASSGARTLLLDLDMIGGGLSSAMKLKGEEGTYAALEAGSLDGFVHELWVERLSLLPVGRRDAEHVGRLSPKAVKAMLRQARERYDVVVADTGPILGSLEASTLCGEADGVVMVLGRGQSHANAQRAFDQLRAVGARVLGLVFNRAKAADFNRSMSSASVRSVPADGTELGALRIGPDQARMLDGLGPMPRTIAASVSKVA